ncbi:L-ectoine synthase [Acetobacter nitrogenifigens DSM 23921 = NBRC 105050]|uniref:L-ectoine synthase n=1 Tax=Acetobacter nitrogenifigens DSM 23921 = NBRC 105050 TaxID=1120919 RepID=A0A511X7S1_9PROT|nr:ectoine synthase [Acetobacter nitrogenifigens]GBQ95911.1 L-ectoine synthase [Acetobacter nitrogenifigens DSM 23921 = NBRC 105050]GEN58988.1 L-ectoine synthase [Acetobacter nitrogenifigens DSM 23921 = NBRC 105050]
MIVRTAQDMRNTPGRYGHGHGWESARLLLASDKMGFSLHETVVQEGHELTLEYRHHLEANYCLEGCGEVVNLANGEVHPIGPGVLYALDRNDRHILRATLGSLRLVCIFSPALAGTEKHVDGGYEPTIADESSE